MVKSPLVSVSRIRITDYGTIMKNTLSILNQFKSHGFEMNPPFYYGTTYLRYWSNEAI